MLDPERSGEVFFLPKRGWILMSESYATAHGSWQDYDREVPVILLPPGRASHAPLAKPDDAVIRMIRISTVLARWLGITPPVSLTPELNSVDVDISASPEASLSFRLSSEIRSSRCRAHPVDCIRGSRLEDEPPQSPELAWSKDRLRRAQGLEKQ